MTVEAVSDITREALFLVIKTALPVLLISMVVGLVISIFQTVTSIQEQTLTFVPKILSIFLSLMLFGHWMLNNIVEFMNTLWSSFAYYTRG